MKKKILLSIFLLMITSFYFFDLSNITGNMRGNKIKSMIENNIENYTKVYYEYYVSDEGEIEVYFCPQQDCEKVLVEFIDSAQKSVHCALFDIGLKSVQEILDKKSKAIEVMVITDNNYLKKFNRSFVREDKGGLMHNKFCVIDGIKVSSGSMNPTVNGAHKNNNNLLLINSEVLASNYDDEFNEMWEGVFKKGDPVLNPSLKLANVSIENYFCPEDNCAFHVKEELKKAVDSIYFMTFSFTHEGIANILLLKHLDDVEIKGVFEARQVTKNSVFKLLDYQDIDVVKDGNKNNMHHKVWIIDEKTVITGSFNPSAGGDTKNDENMLVIHDEEIAKLFLEEFARVYEEAITS